MELAQAHEFSFYAWKFEKYCIGRIFSSRLACLPNQEHQAQATGDKA
jgi:hypothetical protein